MNEHTIELYVLKKNQNKEIQFMKGSDAVPIRFMFRDFGIPEGATATYFIQKPSGAQVHDACEIDRINNSVIVKTNKQMVAEEGLMYIQIHVVVDDRDLITFGHPYRVYGSEMPIESKTYMPLIDAKIIEATNATESANAAAQRAETVAEAAAQGLFSSTIQIGTVTTVEPTEQATVTNSGSDQHPVFDFNIPQGLPGTTVPVTTDLGINTPGTHAADASIAKVINDRLATVENVSAYPEEVITEDTKLLREHDGKVKKGTVTSLLDIIKNKITSWTFNIGTTNKTVPGAIDELNSKMCFKSGDTYTMPWMWVIGCFNSGATSFDAFMCLNKPISADSVTIEQEVQWIRSNGYAVYPSSAMKLRSVSIMSKELGIISFAYDFSSTSEQTQKASMSVGYISAANIRITFN